MTTSNRSIKKPKIALVMIVKNEQKRITVTFDSVKDIVDCFVIVDTGSSDNTMDIVRNYCNEHKIELHMEQKIFPHPFHFANARNSSIELAEDKCDYMLLLDSNDEVKGGKELVHFITTYKGEESGFYMCQEWWCGTGLDKYYNVRLVKSKHGWRYKGAIHEYIQSDTHSKTIRIQNKNIKIYQDRTEDDDKSTQRFSRDEEIFESEYLQNLENGVIQDSRSLFYYAQTCMCLGKMEKAYNLYRERIKQNGFVEEKYHAYYRNAEITRILNHDWEETMLWYLKAFEFSSVIFEQPRVEPIFKIANYYLNKNHQLSYLYAKRCCELQYPHDAVLFVEKRIYDYGRWQILAHVAFHIGEYEIGYDACKKAVEIENKKDDINLLKQYEEKLNLNQVSIESKSVEIKNSKENQSEKLKEKMKQMKQKRNKKK